MTTVILDTVLRWGIVSASLCLFYILFSLGLTLIFGFHQVLNFAHGTLYAVGAFVGLAVYSMTGNYVVALVVATLSTMLIGALFERTIISRQYGKDPANMFLASFAFGFILVGIIKLIAGSQFKSFPTPESLDRSFSVGNVTTSAYNLFFIGISILLIILVHLLLTRTKVGTIIRAGVANRSAVEVLGINVRNYFTFLFALGSALAGIAGVLIAPTLSVYPSMGDLVILWGFVIIIIGGLGSFKGVIAGGILIGLLHALGNLILGPYVQVLTFGILIVILIIRPAGIFGIRGA